jgi:ATP-dependent Zn protease
MGGGNDEREQTLNQILTEMDGHRTRNCCYSRLRQIDILDPAIKRAGKI